MSWLPGELLLGLRYFRNSDNTRRALKVVNYYLDYGTFETTPIIQIKTTMVNHRLNYGTSETARVRQAHSNPVNYCLDYRTSETLDPARSCEGPVSYYLVYGTYEARRYRSLAWPR